MPTIPSVFRPIKPGNYRTTSFKAYKRYSVVPPAANGYNFYGTQHQKYTPPIGAAIAADDPVNINGTNQYMVWNHIDHRYYRYPYDPARTTEHHNRRTVDKFLFLTASLFSIPYFELGEKIKPGSVSITDIGSYSLYDDGNGNLKDSTIDSASFADKRKLAGYWTFNNEFRNLDNNYGIYSGHMEIKSNTFSPDYTAIVNKVAVEPGIPTDTGLSSGLKGGFDGVNSYIKTQNDKEYNPGEGDNFAWSFWIQAGISQSNQDTTYNSLIRKQSDFTEDYWDPINKLVKTRTQYIDSSRYPYHISIKNNQSGVLTNGKIGFAIKGDDATAVVTSTTQCTGSYHHIVAQRSGSEMQLWIDGTKEDSSTAGTGATKNNRDIIFGTKQTDNEFARYSGSMAEMRYYRYGLSAEQISSLANRTSTNMSMYQTSTAGNVFYRNGHIVISSPDQKYHGALSGDYKLAYNGTHTIYENEVLVEVPKDTCNVSMNPSATYNPPDGNETSTDHLSSNGFGELIHPGFISGTMSPYITTIGLYNDKMQMLAVGKLSQPIQKRDDVDMNFIVRWDY